MEAKWESLIECMKFEACWALPLSSCMNLDTLTNISARISFTCQMKTMKCQRDGCEN